LESAPRNEENHREEFQEEKESSSPDVQRSQALEGNQAMLTVLGVKVSQSEAFREEEQEGSTVMPNKDQHLSQVGCKQVGATTGRKRTRTARYLEN
jgi:hypothetical protein